MHQLDQLDFVTRLDPKGMLDLFSKFPDQCAEALSIAQASPLPKWSAKPDNVIVAGMGGSAAGGDFVKALFDADGSIPMVVSRDYTLPNWVGPGTLMFATSYSGNTEETLSAYAQAKKAGANIIVVTGGGKLADLAAADGFPLIRIPGGQPPRTALGLLLLPVVVACEQLGLIPSQNYDQLIQALRDRVSEWGMDVPFERNEAKQLAQNLFGKLAVVYGLGNWQGLVAFRWKSQINENAKDMTFHHTFPELNHNEILGWVNCQNQGVKQWVLITIEDGTESAKIRRRREVSVELLKDRIELYPVVAKGATLLEKMIGVAMLSDFVSTYLASLNGVDPEDITWLNYLKAELAKVN
ncbi:MAG: bifunctional phosphoglucose/phosphomannose isomerase [Chthonomonas sp.]|nr:bifunctional phosphoglucose/phosphomannose isomerase [Chthonomonas sp.]